jgi:hypothetical protein
MPSIPTSTEIAWRTCHECGRVATQTVHHPGTRREIRVCRVCLGVLYPTPYNRHAALGHQMTRYSPNGVEIIEECVDCPSRWLHNPSIGYPVTMRPNIPARKE